MADAKSRYAEALELYRTTSLTITEISKCCGVSRSALAGYIRRNHRDLMFRRRGIGLSKPEAEEQRLYERKGQRPLSQAKYGKAIEACRSDEYIYNNVAEIARLFHVDPNGLRKQLRSHFPEILEWREGERERLGIADRLHRGVKKESEEQYAAAVEHLSKSNDTIRQTAELFNLSYSGLHEHLLMYHKKLADKREQTRAEAKSLPKVRGGLTGNGTLHLPDRAQAERYEEAVSLYRDTAMTQKEIAERLGVPVEGLRNHIRVWHRDFTGQPEDKRYSKSSAAKYADAISRLKAGGLTIAEVARDYGFNPEVFRQYLREHEPRLAASLGRSLAENGRLVSAQSASKYAEAIQLYATTTETLKSIASRLGLTYNSLGGFMRRNHPELIEQHNRLVESAEK